MQYFTSLIPLLQLYIGHARGWTMISYPQLPSAYAFRLKGFESEAQPDPFYHQNMPDLLDLCEQISQASTFVLLEKGTRLPQPTEVGSNYPRKLVESIKRQYYQQLVASLNKLDMPKFLTKYLTSKEVSTSADPEDGQELLEREFSNKHANQYQPLEAKLRKSDANKFRVNLFPCPKMVDFQYFYLSYGFNDDFIYFFTRLQNKVDIEFTALVEKTPDTNISLMVSHTHLEKYFINVLNHSGPILPPLITDDPVCKLNKNQQFRLCSLVHNAFLPAKSPGDMHFLNEVSYCLRNKFLMLKEMQQKPRKYHQRGVRVNALPCSIFEDGVKKSTFFITYDPGEENSVFAFSMNKADRFHEVRAHVRAVSVLKHSKYFY